ncbi:MAG: restriction endonuclease [candidate division WOR-3 bacterium]
MLSDPKVVRLFELLIEQNKTAVEPVFMPSRDGWVSYPLVEEELKVDTDYAVRLLEDLHRMGYLDKQFADKVLFCPACNSQDLKLISLCPRCRSGLLVRRRLLEHKNCGYVGPEQDFNSSDARRCPKCRTELVLIGGDYLSRGLSHICGQCGQVIDSPNEEWTCRSCGRTYGKLDVREQVLDRYVVNQAQLAKLRVERIPKAKVHEFLAKEGYEVQESVHAVGRSGAEHEIDLLATKRSGPLEHRVVVGFASANEAVDSEEVIKLYAKAYDVEAQDIILVASPRLNDDAYHFARHYHIRVFDVDQLNRSDARLTV